MENQERTQMIVDDGSVRSAADDEPRSSPSEWETQPTRQPQLRKRQVLRW
ncbi:MAG: hypothetical protein ACLVJ6_09275 [Merdibacter sp.]